MPAAKHFLAKQRPLFAGSPDHRRIHNSLVVDDASKPFDRIVVIANPPVQLADQIHQTGIAAANAFIFVYADIGLQRELQKPFLLFDIALIPVQPSDVMQQAGNDPVGFSDGLGANQRKLVGFQRRFPIAMAAVALLVESAGDRVLE
ncbi:hypothetical protein D3C74_237700 [compost metagenome]